MKCNEGQITKMNVLKGNNSTQKKVSNILSAAQQDLTSIYMSEHFQTYSEKENFPLIYCGTSDTNHNLFLLYVAH